jgi:hypothetical protein
LIRNHTNRQRDQGDTVDVATPILSKEVFRLANALTEFRSADLPSRALKACEES